MSFGIEFGTKAGADAARNDYEEHLCSDDDRRLKTVEFADATPKHVRDQLEAGAQTGRAERDEGSGQADLTDAEKTRVGPFTGSNNYLKAASVKALLRENGVSDWEAWYDPELSVDEHNPSVLLEAQQAGGGDRIENEGPDRDAAARAEKAAGEQCDHAQDHCKHGDPEACEFLTESCGLDEDEVASLIELGVDGDGVPYDDLDGEKKGALDRSWTGYKTAVRKLAELLDEAALELRNAEKAAAAIDSIEEGIRDMDTEEFEALAAHHETLHQLHQRHAGDDHGQPDAGRVPTNNELAEAEPVRPAAGPPPEFDAPSDPDEPRSVPLDKSVPISMMGHDLDGGEAVPDHHASGYPETPEWIHYYDKPVSPPDQRGVGIGGSVGERVSVDERDSEEARRLHREAAKRDEKLRRADRLDTHPADQMDTLRRARRSRRERESVSRDTQMRDLPNGFEFVDAEEVTGDMTIYRWAAPSDIPNVEEMTLTLMEKGDQYELYAGPDGETNPVTSVEQGAESLPAAVAQAARVAEQIQTAADRDVLEMDEQRGLTGERVNSQARFAGEEAGEAESEVETQVEQNDGGLMADTRRDGDTANGDTEQQVPDEFQVAEGGQETL